MILVAILIAICLTAAVCLEVINTRRWGKALGRICDEDGKEEKGMALIEGKRDFGW